MCICHVCNMDKKKNYNACVCVCVQKKIPSELFRLCVLYNDLIWIALIKLFYSLIVISFCAFGFNFKKNVVENGIHEILKSFYHF